MKIEPGDNFDTGVMRWTDPVSWLQFALFIIGARYLFLLNIIGLFGGNIALNLAIAFTFWRPQNALIAAVAGENESI